jgi:tetratricopeptide (TPR) repeat protein
MKFHYVIIALVLSGIAYFYFNPSYKLSMEAKLLYSMEEYEEAKEAAEKAIELDKYNNMAFFVKNRSTLTLETIEFNREAQKYKEEIVEMLKREKGAFSKADRARAKIMSEIVVAEYEKLSLNLVDNLEVKSEAEEYYKTFLEFKERLEEN